MVAVQVELDLPAVYVFSLPAEYDSIGLPDKETVHFEIRLTGPRYRQSKIELSPFFFERLIELHIQLARAGLETPAREVEVQRNPIVKGVGSAEV